MAANPFHLYAITRLERHAVTLAVRRAISDGGGWITGFRQFSNASIALDLDVTASRLPELHAAIEAVGLTLSPTLAELPEPPPGQDEMPVALRIDFVHDEPDLIIPVPAVPG